MASASQRQFGAAKRDRLSQYCLSCEVRTLCHGDCPKHRFCTTPDGEPGLSYLCEAYKAIFNHMAPYLEMMAERVQAGRPAADIMRVLSSSGTQRRAPVPGRNAPCHCGSGRKYKRCCGA